MSAPRQWFRMYAEAVDDDKLRLLAFEDRWHFVALLCLKASGTIDSDAPHLERRIAVKLGLQLPQLDELKRRLMDVTLIDDNWQPIKWGERQYESETKKKSGYVYFIGHETGDVKIGYSKNPWARLIDINSELGEKFSVLATVRTESTSEVAVHHLLVKFRKRGEWFDRCPIVAAAINAAQAGSVQTEEQLLSFLRSYDVATTNRAEQTQNRTETEQTPRATPAGEMAIALRNLGVATTSDDPTLIGWLRDGYTVDQATAAVGTARIRKPHPERIPAKYLDTILRQPRAPPMSAADRVTWRPPDEECA
jgi:hypothetical protein